MWGGLESKGTMARLLDSYKNEGVAALKADLGIRNPMAVPRLEKVVVSMGTGSPTVDRNRLPAVAEDLAKITGQKPQVRRASQSVSNFKLRKGYEVGCRHGSGILSQYVHSGVDSLARRLAPKEGTAGVFSVRDESAYDLVQTASLANASLFDAGIAVARLQDWKSLDALAEVAMECSSLFAQLREETEAAS